MELYQQSNIFSFQMKTNIENQRNSPLMLRAAAVTPGGVDAPLYEF